MMCFFWHHLIQHVDLISRRDTTALQYFNVLFMSVSSVTRRVTPYHWAPLLCHYAAWKNKQNNVIPVYGVPDELVEPL